MLIESNELREELKHPVWAENWAPDYEMACRETFDNVERCIQRAEEKQRCRNEVEKAQEDVVAWRIKGSVMAILTNDEVKRPVIDHYYELTNRTVDLETMPLKDVPVGGVVIDKFVNRIDAYIKTPYYIGEDEGSEFQMIQIYSSQQDTLSQAAFFNENAKVVYTGFKIKDWGKLK